SGRRQLLPERARELPYLPDRRRKSSSRSPPAKTINLNVLSYDPTINFVSVLTKLSYYTLYRPGCFSSKTGIYYRVSGSRYKITNFIRLYLMYERLQEIFCHSG